MALIQADFFSPSLMRTVTINVILPTDKMVFPGMPVPEKKPLKTLYLLHGIFGNYTDWVTGTRLQAWAQDKGLCVVMPSGENRFYVDNPESENYYGKFIGEDLVNFTRDTFRLSDKREDTFIGGPFDGRIRRDRQRTQILRDLRTGRYAFSGDDPRTSPRVQTGRSDADPSQRILSERVRRSGSASRER